ncbi:serine hydrolase domain-containing protein [Streptomyces sp. NBC_00259]|uniref:serine hydrolase domain-containing protein n=1 Tax=Streptomyces sp. NBC_00259 TaxID=2903643 RepID=UPI002E27DDCD|nr:serine hydrolase domain-containing protein [Streptomyces sp. NBC_00259]
MEARQLASRLQELADMHAVPGAQLAVHTGAGTVSVVAGLECYGEPRAVDTRTAFAYGSVSKVFAATLVLQLVSDGDLELDEPVSDVLAEFREPADARLASITSRQLLSHTSGLVADHELDDSDERSLFRYATSVAQLPLLDRPGNSFSYSNTGYNILGRLVEAVTGLKWRDALQDFLLRPLGVDPYIDHSSERPARALAKGHAVRPGQREARPVDQFLPPTWTPAGGLSGSAQDLIALARLHMGTDPKAAAPLEDEQRVEMRTAVPGADAFGMADAWALGLGHYGSSDNRWLGHDGTVDGGTAHLRFHPESGLAVALTTNATTGSSLWPDVVGELRTLGIAVGDYEPGVPTPDPSASGVGTGPRDFEPLVGDYGNGDTVFSIRRHDDGIRLSDRTGLVADVTVHDSLSFTARRVDTDAAPYVGRFVLDGGTGEIALLQLAGRSAKRTHAAA